MFYGVTGTNLNLAGITYCQYKDSERVLGNTFGMCILQDFEALTPNLLARTIETVEGGGLVILLLRSLSSLTSLYTMVMDVHERFRTESHSLATGRFNERFLLSLASCESCIVMDDELNILPISSHMKSVTPVPVEEDSEGLSEADRDLKDLKEQLKDDFPVGPLIKKCCTLDQGKAVITFLDAILDKTLRSTVALLAGRGRGKSAALGLAVAGAVAAGYSNIFVTAPSPENLRTLFEFVSKGFDMLEYKEHLDYDIVKSSNPELKKVTIRINIYKQHRQTIQYIQPHEHGKLSQVELLVVDEAAAIPLPLVKSLLGPYLVFLSSTVNGYEGTGRSLSLKLLQQLEEQSRASTKSTDAAPSDLEAYPNFQKEHHLQHDSFGRLFRKIDLSEAIRYASGDPIESWLNNLLCLDIANSIPSINRLPPPSECDLYYVNRDTLFSYHKDSELFLQRMMALYVASHYKNSPNDLQLLADAPAHHLFVLLGPVNESRNQLPDILCVIQVCLEGKISQASAMRSLSAGHQPSGDQIPWKFCEQFQDKDFPSLSGARIVRIATHPNAMKLGYGSAAIQLLSRYFEGQFTPISEEDVQNDPESPHLKITEAAEKVSLLEENIKPRSDLPPLLVHLRERQPEKLHYLGVSFGLTLDLFRFWRKHKFAPFYICEVPNSVTGEHTCMLLKPLDTDDIEVSGSDELGFFGPYYRAFRSAFARLLCSPKFNTMEYKLAMSILDPKLNFTDVEPSSTISHGIYDDIIKSPISMKRLEAYVNHLADHHLISDLKLPLAYLYFQEKFPVTLSYAQASVLLCMGLQNQDASYAEGVMKLERQQILSLFMKVMKKFQKYLNSVSSKQFSATLPPVKEVELKPHSISVDEDLDEAAKKVKDDMKAKSDGLLNLDFLQRYAIADKDVDFESALQNGSGKIPSGGVVSVKSSKTKAEKYGKPKDKSDKKRSKDGQSSKSSKKKRTS
ncbi:RNA cytidine acetyltransferase 2-like isoform X3 [Cynara cardunculus var. scolymus]|uniref:RNA cytidine acetyltransferase 2-like isoform X3 n=1 Tax=Cynara cardunculus var. scolymus TaxID=59895 RepID=UPI000D62B27B|nr:RNA cytidine acetyltransferase 2-like isoform X3 [Cynara cardunculus var. scolymus]